MILGCSTLVSSLTSQLKATFSSTKFRITDIFSHMAQVDLVSDKKGSVWNSARSQSSSPTLPPTPQSGTSDEDVPGPILTIMWKAVLGAQDISHTIDACGHR